MIHITCIQCKQSKPVNCTDEQLARWQGGELIQNAMPNVPADERELLISGICGKCFDAMFAPKDDEIPEDGRLTDFMAERE